MGGKGTTPVTTVCMSRSWKVEVCQKKNTLEQMINQQSAARSTSYRYEATQTIFVSYVPTRPLALDRQMTTATESGTTATTKHTDCISAKSLLGEKKHQTRTMRYGTNACHSLVSSVDTVDLLRPLRGAAQQEERLFSPCFLCRNLWYTLASCHKICHRQKAYCVY